MKLSESLRLGADAPLVLIAGPCVIESEAHAAFLAAEIGRITGGPFVFKASFDKANRSSVGSFRGLGIDEGLRIWRGIRDRGHTVLTDIHGRGRLSARPRRWISCRSLRSCAGRRICW